MKRLAYILFLLIISLTACHRHMDYPPAMQQAEALIDHHLLTIQAKDKQYIIHTSDSLINRIVQFYEGYSNKDRLMIAYFYQGSNYVIGIFNK